MMMSTNNQAGRILISGAGIAGPVAGYWFAQAGYEVTIVERAPSIRTSGQSIDVRGHALTILQRMGLEEAVRSRSTHEKGLRFIDAQGTTKAEFPVDPEGASFTADIEIQRGDLAEILYEATRDQIEYIFNESIASVSEHRDSGRGIIVEFANGPSARRFDLLVIADGVSSRTRSMVFSDISAPIKNLCQWSAWFTMPRLQNDDDDGWARWYNASRGRIILVRPDQKRQKSRVSLWIMTNPKVETALVDASTNTERQKQLFADLFADADWSETPRTLEGMATASDFYAQRVAQVQMPRWSTDTGRVALVGDAAYCPSPISGLGATVAVTGAYILAGEVVRNRSDIASGLHAYERRMRPFVATAQELFPGTPRLMNPSTRLGIWIMHLILAFVAWSGLARVLGERYTPPADAVELPEYSFSWGFFRGKKAAATSSSPRE